MAATCILSTLEAEKRGIPGDESGLAGNYLGLKRDPASLKVENNGGRPLMSTLGMAPTHATPVNMNTQMHICLTHMHMEKRKKNAIGHPNQTKPKRKPQKKKHPHENRKGEYLGRGNGAAGMGRGQDRVTGGGLIKMHYTVFLKTPKKAFIICN